MHVHVLHSSWGQEQESEPLEPGLQANDSHYRRAGTGTQVLCKSSQSSSSLSLFSSHLYFYFSCHFSQDVSLCFVFQDALSSIVLSSYVIWRCVCRFMKKNIQVNKILCLTATYFFSHKWHLLSNAYINSLICVSLFVLSITEIRNLKDGSR